MFKLLIVFFTAMTPFLDLKLAIPLGIKFGFTTSTTLLFAIAGNVVPAAIILALLGPLTKYGRDHSPKIDNFFKKLFAKTQNHHAKYADKLEKYGLFFIAFFVATPLPGSGTIGGSLLAFLIGLDYWKALVGITLGVTVAGIFIMGSAESVVMLWHHFVPLHHALAQ